MGKLSLALLSCLLFGSVAILAFTTGNLLMGWVAAIWSGIFAVLALRARAHGGGEGL